MSNTEAETGVCFFAYNNEKIDYIQLAHISAAYVKANQKNKSTCLITDNGTYQYLKDSIDPKLHIKCFDHVDYREDKSKTRSICTRIHQTS